MKFVTKQFILFSIFLLIGITVFSQERKKTRDKNPVFVTPLFGVHALSSVSAEAGISRSVTRGMVSTSRTHSFNHFNILTQSLSSELFFVSGPIPSLKYGCWYTNHFIKRLTYGINLLYISDFRSNDWSIRPETGFYLGRFPATYNTDYTKNPVRYYFQQLHAKLVYSYQIPLHNVYPISPHRIGLVFFMEANDDYRGILK